MRIIVASDSHGRNDLLYKLQKFHKEADVFIHCGDLEDDPKRYPGWLFVKGNNEFYGGFVNQRIVYLKDGHRIFVVHSHRCSNIYRKEALYQKGKTNQCDIVCYGHTHIFDVSEMHGILLVNPGSLIQNRDGRSCSYAIIDIHGNDIRVRPVFEEDWFNAKRAQWWESQENLDRCLSKEE